MAHDKLLNFFRNNHHSGNSMSMNPMVGHNIHNGNINSLFIDIEYDVYTYKEFQAISTWVEGYAAENFKVSSDKT